MVELKDLNKGIGSASSLSYIPLKLKEMKVLLDKKQREPKPKQFILLNEYCQVFCGLQGGYPAFSDDIEEAKPLERDSQIRLIQQGTSFRLEKEYL
jgi:hypothetical protein